MTNVARQPRFLPRISIAKSRRGFRRGRTRTKFLYDNNGNEVSGPATTIAWTPANMVSSVTVSGVTDTFYYGPERQRYEEVTAAKTIIYATAQQYEVNVTASGTTDICYIYAGGSLIAQYSAAAGATSGALRYFHKNNQGSTVLVTNETGATVEAYSYDVWGKRRNLDGTDGAQAAATYTPDYTGQEAMDNVGLVNMNGRVYNPVTGQFLSADPIVQAPGNLQSYNRYAYVWNNPLTLTDPSGFCGSFDLLCEAGNLIRGANNALTTGIETLWHNDAYRTSTAILAAYYIGFYNWGTALNPSYGVFGSGGTTELSLEQFGNAVAAGAAQGGISSGTADGALNGVESAVLFYAAGTAAGGNESLAIVTHAAAGCELASISGGNCANGAIAAAIPQAAQAAGVYKGMDNYQTLVAASVIGGTTSALSGGSFANGARTAAYGYLFNDCMHNIDCLNPDQHKEGYVDTAVGGGEWAWCPPGAAAECAAAGSVGGSLSDGPVPPVAKQIAATGLFGLQMLAPESGLVQFIGKVNDALSVLGALVSGNPQDALGVVVGNRVEKGLGSAGVGAANASRAGAAAGAYVDLLGAD